MIKNTLGQIENFTNTHYPSSKEQLLELILHFNSKNETYYVVSTGNNWGYGCDHSFTKSTHCINLKKMNRIIEFDIFNGIITIEPGVTYGQLSTFLEEKEAEWLTPVHGGGPNCSLIGNTLERGYGITPITDHFQACQSLEAILPNGEFYSSPLKSMGLPRLGKLFKYGIGPYLDGIFTQSNFGIVTQMSIKLATKGKNIQIFFVDISNQDLPQSVIAIKEIKKILGPAISGMNLMNKERLLSMLIEYPKDKVQNRLPLDQDYIDLNVKNKMIAPWTIVGAIYGDDIQVKAYKKIIKRELQYINGRKLFFSERKVKLLETISSIFPTFFKHDLKTASDSISQLMNILKGIPQNTALKLAYWKNLQAPPLSDLNPKKDNCGLIWYAPLVEMNYSKVIEYIEFINEVSKKFEMTPLVTLTTIDELCFDSTIPILFNQDDVKDKNRAHEYFNTLLSEGKKKGFYPYRLGTNSMDHYLDELDDSYRNILTNLKHATDPKGLFAAGRYSPSSSRSKKENRLSCL